MKPIISLKNPTHQYTLDELFTHTSTLEDMNLLSYQPSCYQREAIERLKVYFDITDFDILEVGADDANSLYELRQYGMHYGLGINNWCIEEKNWTSDIRFELAKTNHFITRFPENIVLSYGDIRNLPIQNQSFDLIFSIATFEHIHDLETALQEMYRLLKPNGFIYSNFGPIWSGAVGHHLWCEIGDYKLKFTEPSSFADFLKPHEHLLYSAEHLKQKLIPYYSETHINELIHQIYEHPHINRYTYADYRRIVMNSPFKVITFKKMWDIPVEPAMLAQLQQKYGYTIDFSCSSLEIVLQKK